MTESDRQLFVKVLGLDPVHQDLSENTVGQYDRYLDMCEAAGTVPSTSFKVLFAFLYSDEEPRDLLKEIPEPHALAEGDKVFVENWTKRKLARLGTVVDIAGLSEKGKVRVAIKGDSKKYREIPVENVHYIP